MQILCAVRQTIGISYDCSRAGPGECASTQFSAPSLLVDGHRLGTNKSTRPYLHVAIGITTYDLNPSGRQFAIGLADSRERVPLIVACLEGKRNCGDTHCHRNPLRSLTSWAAPHCTEPAAARSHRSMHPAAVDHLIESAVQSGYRANDDFPPEAAGGAPLRDHVSIVSRSPLS